MRLLGPFSLHRLQTVFGAVLISMVFGGTAIAEDLPFDLESSSWMSFDRYKEKPSSWVSPSDRAAEALKTIVPPPPTIPPPTVPLPPPVVAAVMPGVNRGFDVKVDSTEDDNQFSESPLANFDTKPDLQPRKNWQDAAKAARQSEERKKRSVVDEDHPPLDIRLSYLPRSEVKHKAKAAAPAAKPEPKKVKIAQEPPPAPVADAAACAAVDAYKKRQLAAIESDRQTLTALQNAIAQLDLGKQLGFMVSEGKLTVQGDTNMDMPASPPLTTANH
jgi:hypothetical protein